MQKRQHASNPSSRKYLLGLIIEIACQLFLPYFRFIFFISTTHKEPHFLKIHRIFLQK